VITSLQQIIPPAVSAGMGSYPENAAEIIKEKTPNPILVDALPLAQELGNPRLVNTILLAIMANMLDLPLDQWKTVIARRVPPKFKELNLIAFDRGREF
jgi:indolepyruvate ferredoxin oxidoreductase beta subunit